MRFAKLGAFAAFTALAAAPAFAEEAPSQAADSGTDFYFRADAGLDVGNEIAADYPGLGSIEWEGGAGAFLQVGLGWDFGPAALDITLSDELIALDDGAGGTLDASVATILVSGEIKLSSNPDNGPYLRGGVGVSGAYVEDEYGYSESSHGNGGTVAIGGGFRFPMGGVKGDVGYEYRSTQDVEFDGGVTADFNRHVFRFGIRFG